MQLFGFGKKRSVSAAETPLALDAKINAAWQTADLDHELQDHRLSSVYEMVAQALRGKNLAEDVAAEYRERVADAVLATYDTVFEAADGMPLPQATLAGARQVGAICLALESAARITSLDQAFNEMYELGDLASPARFTPISWMALDHVDPQTFPDHYALENAQSVHDHFTLAQRRGETEITDAYSALLQATDFCLKSSMQLEELSLDNLVRRSPALNPDAKIIS